MVTSTPDIDNDDIQDAIDTAVNGTTQPEQQPLSPEEIADEIANNTGEGADGQLNDPNQNFRNPKLFMKKWQRFPERLDFHKPLLNLVSGPRGEGKSSLLEVLTSLFVQLHGAKGVIDAFSSRDGEGLAWCRHKDFKDSVIFIHGDNTKIACEYDTVPISKVNLKQLLEYKAVITVPKFYRNNIEEFAGLGRLLQILWDRDYWARGDLRVLNLREGINVASSRLSLGGGQSDAKAQFIYALNQFRHAGFAVNLDCLRLKSIDINVREIADCIWLKQQGIFGLPDDLRFLYKKYDLVYDLMRIPKYGFILLTIKGGYGHGVFQKPYWHKETNENINKIVGITAVEYEEETPDQPQSAFTDFDHVTIIKSRLELNDKGKPKGTHIIAKELHISSATAKNHIDYHNNDVEQKGECERCRRAKFPLSKQLISRWASNQRNPESSLPSTKEKLKEPEIHIPVPRTRAVAVPTAEEVADVNESIEQSTLPQQDKTLLKEIVKSKAKPDVAHEDEANLESSPYYGENNTGD